MKLRLLILIIFAGGVGVGCNTTQPQYWGEGVYDMENVKLGMNVDTYYSHASDNYEKQATRYYEKQYPRRRSDSGSWLDTDSLTNMVEFWSRISDGNEMLAKFQDAEFFYTGMLADTKSGLIGVLARGEMDEKEQVNALLKALAAKYGDQCDYSKEAFGDIAYGWKENGKTIEFYVRASNYLGNGDESEADVSYEIYMYVTDSNYDAEIDSICEGNWIHFQNFAPESEKRSIAKILNEEV